MALIRKQGTEDKPLSNEFPQFIVLTEANKEKDARGGAYMNAMLDLKNTAANPATKVHAEASATQPSLKVDHSDPKHKYDDHIWPVQQAKVEALGPGVQLSERTTLYSAKGPVTSRGKMYAPDFDKLQPGPYANDPEALKKAYEEQVEAVKAASAEKKQSGRRVPEAPAAEAPEAEKEAGI